MLPITSLDNEFYDEIYEKARKMIPGIYPAWTDYNEHDPGVTFLQLLSWLKEMQQFHLDQIGEEHLMMFLKLLGGKQREKCPAKTVVKCSRMQEKRYLPEGTICMAGDIPFETVQGELLQPVQIVSCRSEADGEEKRIGKDLLQSGKKLKFYPFGELPQEGACFWLQFDKPLESGTNYTVYMDILDEYAVKRNPIQDKFFPLADVEISSYGENGLQPCVNVEDYTHQFLQSGLIRFMVPAPMVPMQDGTYGICFCLKRCEYDVVPVLQTIQTDVLEVCQTNTLINYEDISFPTSETGEYSFVSTKKCFTEGPVEVYRKDAQGFVELSQENVSCIQEQEKVTLSIVSQENTGEETVFRIVGYGKHPFKGRNYEMTGFPYQQILLHDTAVLPEVFTILVENPEFPGVWEEWTQVSDFHTASPESKVYCLNSEQGIIRFGDCEQGMAPEGRLRIIRYVQTLGIRGNVRKGQIQNVIYPSIPISLTNTEDVSNGADKESIEYCFARIQQELWKVHRAITAEDYEMLVRQTPGLRVQRVKTVPVEFMKKQDGSFAENSVAVVVQPVSYKKYAKLTDAYLKNLRKQLDAKRLIGTKVQILSPEYIGVTVSVDLVVKSHYPNAHALIEETIQYYFEHNGAEFGALLEESELYGLLDEKEYVSEVRNLSIHAQGKGVHVTVNGNIKLPVNGLSYLKHIDYMITAGED